MKAFFLDAEWFSGGFKRRAALAMLLSFLGGGIVMGQGTIEFSALLARQSSGVLGRGIFTLSDHIFTYSVSNRFGISQSEIRGPGPDPDALVIFTLDLTLCEVPGPGGIFGGCFFNGNEVLTDDQINQLVLGDWYVWARAPGNPNDPISGQIVPEPTSAQILVIALLGLGLVGYLQKLRSQPQYPKR